MTGATDGERRFHCSTLEDVERVHRAHPRTFSISIPRSDQRCDLRPGQLVKLVFLLDEPAEDAPRAERMWVEVRQRDGGRYRGVLENHPRSIGNLHPGDTIECGPEHVAAVYDPSDDDALPRGASLKVDPRILAGEAWPARAVRVPPTDENPSGWSMYGEAAATGVHGADTELVSYPVDDILRRYRVLDSVLYEPVGTAWRWSEDAAEYQPQPP